MRPISDEIRAKVIAELIAGAPVNETARKYKLGQATVSRLRNEMAPELLERIGTEKQTQIDDLLLESVANHLRGLDAMIAYVSTPDYLKDKKPEGVAELYKELRAHPLSILEAASALEDGTDVEDEEP